MLKCALQAIKQLTKHSLQMLDRRWYGLTTAKYWIIKPISAILFGENIPPGWCPRLFSASSYVSQIKYIFEFDRK